MYSRLVLALLLMLAPLGAAGASTTVVISELQTGSSESASQEFVELYNASAEAVDVSGWKVQYKSAASENVGSSWSTKATLSATISAHGYLLIAPQTYLAGADVNMNAGLAASGGHVRLVDAGGTVIDLVGWGTANAPEQQAATAPAAGESLERLAGERSPLGGNAYDTDNNAANFSVRAVPEPQEAGSFTEAPVPESEWETARVEEVTPPADLAVAITELMVDPASPQSDANDEFIELHNYGETAANLSGYLLKTGSQFRDSHTIGTLVIEPGEYAVLYSRQTHLSLTNAGGSARLLAPGGEVVAEAADYEEAPVGESWAAFDDGWQWTLRPTPGADNALELAPPEVAAAKAAKAAKAKKAKAAKTASAKASKVKTAAAKTTAGSADLPEATAAARTTDPASRGLLIGALGLTIAYALYEYRHDIRNQIIRARRKLGARGADRPPA